MLIPATDWAVEKERNVFLVQSNRLYSLLLLLVSVINEVLSL